MQDTDLSAQTMTHSEMEEIDSGIFKALQLNPVNIYTQSVLQNKKKRL